MDKTININLAGTLFSIDEEAYKILRDYLQAIDLRFRNTKGGNETVEDIESRISEIFQSQKGTAGVITRANVEYMISIIGKPEDFESAETEEEIADHSIRRKRLYRNPDDTIISGVCGGIGAYFNTDPVLLRILFVIFTVFFGFGFFIYLILWISLPVANNETRRREMYGNEYGSIMARKRQYEGSRTSYAPSYNKGYYENSRLGNAINEVFRAAGRVLFIIMRIFLVFVGAMLLLTAFIFLLTLVLIFVFKMPGAFSTNALDFNIVYFPDFLNYLVSPATFPWIIILGSLVIVLPLLALIYWGVKMIFWFRAKDGALSLVLIVVWALASTALAILLFSEGVSFAESSRSSAKIPIDNPSDTIYITSVNRVSDLISDRTLPFNTEGYSVLINDEKRELYISPELEIDASDEEPYGITVRKESYGSSEITAFNKTKDLDYYYRISGDSLFFDDYFTIHSGRKWSGDNIKIRISLPAGTTLKIDSCMEELLDDNYHSEDDDNHYPMVKSEGYSYWQITDEGLIPAGRKSGSGK
jgi:phage shock protein PspC (stress-responsive transcriptional regulator)